MRRVRGALGLAFVLMLSHSPLAAQNKVVAEIPIQLERNKTVIPVTVGASGPLRLILDSGMSSDGILIFDVAKVDLTQFDHLADIRIEGAGRGGASHGVSDDATTFFVGPRRFENQRVTILTSGTYKGSPTDGVIGYSLLGHFAVELDYDRNRMILYEPSTFSPGAGWASIDIYFKDNRIPWTNIAATAAEEDPVQLSAYIDCAAGETLELLERENNAITLSTKAPKRYAGRGLSGDIYGKKGRLSRVLLGPFVLKDVAVLVVPAEVRSRQNGADAIMGNNALRRFNVVFDYAHLKIHLRPNRYFAEPFR